MRSTEMVALCDLQELCKICVTDDLSSRIIPVFVGEVDMRGDFLGTKKQQKRDANFIRTKISGNCIPPPDMGLFQDNWEENCRMLVTRVKELITSI